MGFTRRKALAGLGLAGLQAMLFSVRSKAAPSPACPFRLAVINDEITPDFERACQIASQDFGLSWIELRSMWNKNVTELNAKERLRGVRDFHAVTIAGDVETRDRCVD